MNVLATCWFWLIFGLTAPLEFALGGVLALVSWPLDRQRNWLHAFVCRWTFQYLRVVPGWKVEVLGRELLPDGPAVIVANHQSMADVVAMMGLFHRFKFVSKASLFRLPLVGWMMSLCRYVALERGKPSSMHRMMSSCRNWLREGVAVLLFPEGTYSEGKGLLPFKRGAFRLAVEEQVPVVPVVLRGTTGLVDGDGPWMSPRCRITVTVLPPLPAAALGDDAGALCTRVRAIFEEELGGPAPVCR